MSARLDPEAVLDLAWDQSPGTEARSPLENLRAFIAHLKRRQARNYDSVVAVSGEPGVGKSSLGIQLVKGVSGELHLDNVAYSAEEVLRAYRNLAPGSSLLYDESVLGLMSQGGGRDDELRAMIQALSIVRVKRITAILCVPDIGLLDSFVKFGRATFWIHVRERGVAKVHRAWKGARYRTSRSLLPYDEGRAWNPLGFEDLAKTDPATWRAYEELKLDRVDKQLDKWLRDPSGRVEECPDCGFRGNRHNVETHRCKAREPPAAVTARRVAPAGPTAEPRIPSFEPGRRAPLRPYA